MKDYTVFVDGISKCFAATGVRVGWSLGPELIISKVKAILSHIGAWAPMAEQVATAEFLKQDDAVAEYMKTFKQELADRLNQFHNGFQQLKQEGFNIDSIAPEAAMYLTLKIDLVGKRKADGTIIEQQMDVWQYILNEAKVAIVPFGSFGADKTNPWYRLSVGTSKLDEITKVIAAFKNALSQLS
jgi:aspartate aminotransferase